MRESSSSSSGRARQPQAGPNRSPCAPASRPTCPGLWRWQHGTPDAEWRRWDGPYFQHRPSALSMDESLARALPPGPHERVIDIGGAARGLVTRSWEAPQTGGWLDLGIVLYDPAFWSGGHGTRALSLWTGLCPQKMPAHVLTPTSWSGNGRLLRAALRVGYRECARIWEVRLWEGVRYDSAKLDLLRSGWSGPE